jgi:hypothetical protein
VTPRKDQRKVNRHAGPNDRANAGGSGLAGVNGHGPASTERGGVPQQRDRAASDDVSGITVAGDAGSINVSGTVRQACAEVAPPPPNGASQGASAVTANNSSAKNQIPGGEFALPVDPGEFVEEIHSRIDLFKVWQTLLRSKDNKIKQRAVEKLTEMRYKGAAALADEPQQIVIDIDSAVARRAAEGA